MRLTTSKYTKNIQYDLRTCTRVDKQLHNFVTVEFGSIVHGRVAVWVLGIKNLCFAILGQLVDPLIDQIFLPISGSLQERGGGKGGREVGKMKKEKEEGKRGEEGSGGGWEKKGEKKGKKEGEGEGRRDEKILHHFQSKLEKVQVVIAISIPPMFATRSIICNHTNLALKIHHDFVTF